MNRNNNQKQGHDINSVRKIYLSRHGQTDWNLIGRLQGHTDIPLNEEGRRQATLLGAFLKSHKLPQVSFYSSPLVRAQETLKLAGINSENIQLSPLLMEVRLGDIEGKTEADILINYPTDSMQRWRSLDWEDDFKFPGGEGKLESVERFSKFLTSENNKMDLFIMSHGLVLRRFLGRISNNKDFEKIANTSIYVIEQDLKNNSFKYIHKIYPG